MSSASEVFVKVLGNMNITKRWGQIVCPIEKIKSLK